MHSALKYGVSAIAGAVGAVGATVIEPATKTLLTEGWDNTKEKLCMLVGRECLSKKSILAELTDVHLANERRLELVSELNEKESDEPLLSQELDRYGALINPRMPPEYGQSYEGYTWGQIELTKKVIKSLVQNEAGEDDRESFEFFKQWYTATYQKRPAIQGILYFNDDKESHEARKRFIDFKMKGTEGFPREIIEEFVVEQTRQVGARNDELASR